MNTQIRRPSLHSFRGALSLALACATAVLLAACGELSAAVTTSDPPPATHDVAAADKADRAYDGWNHNTVDVRVISGTGRHVLR